jgi:hypothetical protein
MRSLSNATRKAPALEPSRSYYRVYEDAFGLGDVQSLCWTQAAAIQIGDAVPALLREVHSFRNNSSQDYELMIIGIARQKRVLDSKEVK